MAIDKQRVVVIKSLVQGVGSLMSTVEFLASVQTLVNDASLTGDPPTEQELVDAGFDWFTIQEFSEALTAVSNVITEVTLDVNRIPLNNIRKEL